MGCMAAMNNVNVILGDLMKLNNIYWVAVLLMVSACASVPNSRAFNTVQVALDAAYQAGPDVYAKADVQEAEARWVLAKKAQQDGDRALAEYYAQQTLVNLALAETRAREQHAQVAVQEVQSSLDRLRTLMSDPGE
jgi:hypothetical protein